ncbi:MAG: aminomethyl-transferring glycine dehydrogenase subunit GcvPB, partial [Acidobacteria bacterium]|nr:aminomethyl-transferring glycine dehydrogenase subunit GcvPB [Acidobacteriota bacterium]
MSQPGGRAASAPLMGREVEPTIFELSATGRTAYQLRTTDVEPLDLSTVIPAPYLRAEPVRLPEVSERDLVGHVTRLTHRQFSVDLGFYPLGSCTMKYNPKIADWVTGLEGLNSVHPGAPAELCQGWLELLATLEERLCTVTGMA